MLDIGELTYDVAEASKYVVSMVRASKKHMQCSARNEHCLQPAAKTYVMFFIPVLASRANFALRKSVK